MQASKCAYLSSPFPTLRLILGLYWHVFLRTASIWHSLDPASAGYHVLTQLRRYIQSSRLFTLPITKTSMRSVASLYLTTSMPCTINSPAAVHTLANSRETPSHFRPLQVISLS
ncbi:hypothetical protein EV401DRAFT_1900328 [Pisolithus croceorrhizus]|nr:hypothetical protein EV401DRAFT_1900328 [Pisolithus croceorrhizus]